MPDMQVDYQDTSPDDIFNFKNSTRVKEFGGGEGGKTRGGMKDMWGWNLEDKSGVGRHEWGWKTRVGLEDKSGVGRQEGGWKTRGGGRKVGGWKTRKEGM